MGTRVFDSKSGAVGYKLSKSEKDRERRDIINAAIEKIALVMAEKYVEQYGSEGISREMTILKKGSLPMPRQKNNIMET